MGRDCDDEIHDYVHNEAEAKHQRLVRDFGHCHAAPAFMTSPEPKKLPLPSAAFLARGAANAAAMRKSGALKGPSRPVTTLKYPTVPEVKFPDWMTPPPTRPTSPAEAASLMAPKVGMVPDEPMPVFVAWPRTPPASPVKSATILLPTPPASPMDPAAVPLPPSPKLTPEMLPLTGPLTKAPCLRSDTGNWRRGTGLQHPPTPTSSPERSPTRSQASTSWRSPRSSTKATDCASSSLFNSISARHQRMQQAAHGSTAASWRK